MDSLSALVDMSGEYYRHERGREMTTGVADGPGLRLGSFLRRSLVNRTSVPPSRWLEKTLSEIHELERRICDGWDDLAPEDREFFHGLVLGLIPKESLADRMNRGVWEVTTFLNMTFNREESIEYLSAIRDLFEKIKHHVGADVWRETLANAQQVDRAKRGHQQIASGRFKVVHKP